MAERSIPRLLSTVYTTHIMRAYPLIHDKKTFSKLTWLTNVSYNVFGRIMSMNFINSRLIIEFYRIPQPLMDHKDHDYEPLEEQAGKIRYDMVVVQQIAGFR